VDTRAVELLVALGLSGLTLIACAVWSYVRNVRSMPRIVWPPATRILPKEPMMNVSWRGHD